MTGPAGRFLSTIPIASMYVSDKITQTSQVFSKPAPSSATVSDNNRQCKAKTNGYGMTPIVYDFGVSTSPNKWIAGGDGTNVLAISYDGKRWFVGGSPANNVTAVNCIANNGSVWVVGTTNTDSSGTIFYSADGLSWTSVYTTTSRIMEMKHNGTMFVAFSSNGNTFYSYDGALWLQGTISYTGSTPTNISNIGWNGIYWLIGSNGSDSSGNRVWKSSDGIQWTSITTVTTTNVYAIIWTGQSWFVWNYK
jgi:hypothetical protein